MTDHRPTTVRHAWVDTAKGVTILLVVLLHAGQQLEGLGMAPPALVWVNHHLLAGVRMPLLLLASGLFAATTLSGPWRAVLHKRVAHYAYLYVVWCLLWALLLPVPRAYPLPPRQTSWPLLLEWLVVPSEFLWFVYALALYSMLLRLLRSCPTAPLLLAAAALSAAVSDEAVSLPGWTWRQMAVYFIFFAVGVRCGPALLAAARRVTVRVASVVVPACVAVLGATALLGLHALPGMRIVTSAAFVVLASVVCILGARTAPGRGAAWLGERTLPVYVLHMTWLLLFSAPAVALSWRASPSVGLVVLPAAVALAVAGSLLAHHLLVAAGASWLFGLPRRWAHRPTPAERALPGRPVSALRWR